MSTTAPRRPRQEREHAHAEDIRAVTQIEERTIEPIPDAERHGRTRELAAIWFGMNMLPLTIVTGALATLTFGLPFWWSVLAIALGNMLGGIFMALHAGQGPQLGIPQMIQARGQFGVNGASLIVVIAIVMFMGYFAANVVLSGQALNGVWGGLSVNAWIVVSTLASLAVATYGYGLIRWVTAVGGYIVGAIAVYCLVRIVADGLPHGAMAHGAFSAAGFFTMLSIGATWQLTYAPYVSDYSRYMPRETGGRGAFIGTYVGSVASSILLMVLGALVGVAGAGDDAVAGLQHLVGGAGTIVLVSFAAAGALSNSGNAYCAMLCTLTVGETVRRGWTPRRASRLAVTLALHAAGLVIGLAGQGDFLDNYSNFVIVLMYVLVPWSAINLLDYYVLRKGHYDVEAFLSADGGIYGRWNVPALVVYAIGLVVQIPFMSTALYTGPLATRLEGVDIAWVVGLVVSAGAYGAWAHRAARSSGPVLPIEPMQG
jgi:NCS1 family nucleobase:cation symporter-1